MPMNENEPTTQEWVENLGSSCFLSRSRALASLHSIGTPAIEEVLRAYEEDLIHPSSFDGIAAWLGTLGEEGISEMAEGFARAPILIMAGLVACGEEAIPALMEALTSEGDPVRRWAAYGLGHFGEKAYDATYVLRAAGRVGGTEKTVEAIEEALRRTASELGDTERTSGQSENRRCT